MATQQQLLAYNQETIDPIYPAPKRNKHIFGVFADDADNSFYFNPNYDYGSDNIPIYQQEVVVKTEGEGGADKYATFAIEEDTEKTLVINYTKE